MKKLLVACVALLLCSSHDLFLKLDTYYLPAQRLTTIHLLNGTYAASENVIARDRMLDVSLVGNGARTPIDTSSWLEVDNSTVAAVKTGLPGTKVFGVSTRARNIDLAADAFNGYLEHDGILDELERRRSTGELDRAATERYSKHVKTLFQVGDRLTDDYATALDYPIEFIPLSNPYAAAIGDKMTVRLLRDGQPLPDQLVYLGLDTGGHAHDHATGEEHDHTADVQQFRTDAAGEFTFSLTEPAVYYLRTVHLVPVTEAGLTHESNWATLTFAAGNYHGTVSAHAHADGHTHNHADGESHEHHHEHEAGELPGWAYWLVSLLLITGLFFYFRRTERA